MAGQDTMALESGSEDVGVEGGCVAAGPDTGSELDIGEDVTTAEGLVEESRLMQAARLAF